MSRLSILLLAIVLACGLSVGGVARAAACTCLQMTAAEAFEAAHLVVEGVVIGKSAPERASVTYTVAVERVHKGEAGDLLAVVTAQDSAACGLMMDVGQRWRLNMGDYDGQLSTSLCSGSELLADSAPIPSPSLDSGRSFLFGLGPGLVGLLALMLAWLFGAVIGR